ncbi:hypothetical protein Xmau_01600 [Xenorhabdus mauleonii]|uniref:Uncharacterized protein n=1 Tax=Xenorhabdus mauleonii TaxID=351675 RepID=A0A1I3P848_9GAMM|nr:hypothetical protein [Xenorhabdus mauleonii]PHM44886.1 hypothetical protein Xmau_01600 [Xenorhabdus mauleonii]SFJ17683.1 hypothetical protein SAMN05421680_10661 [Xenorhabdus mauleonii]
MSELINLDNDKLNVKYTLEAKGDLIIGQIFLLGITVDSKEKITPEAHISISNISNNISFSGPGKAAVGSSIHFTPDLNKSMTSATVTIECMVNSKTQYGDDITFDISSNIIGFTNRQYKRTAKDIDPVSLNLIVDNTYLQPTDVNNAQTNASSTQVHTVITDQKYHNPLSNVPIFIAAAQNSQLKLFTYSSDDAGDKILPIISFEHKNGMMINSDSTGKITLYVHTKESLSGKVQLISNILGIFNVGYASPIYSLYGGKPNDSSQIAWPPSILGYDPIGYLTSKNGERDFIVTIPQYDHAAPGDTVFFLVGTQGGNPEYSGQNITITNPKSELGAPYFHVPYQIFKYGVKSTFSYIIVKESGSSLTSIPLPLTYMGGTPYSPEDGVSRDYKRCLVYTSLGVGGGVRIANNGQVNHDNIIKYPDGAGTGLFIQVLGTNDPNAEPDKVPIGTMVTLKSYINSANKNGITSYPPFEIKQQSDGNIYGIFNMPYDDLNMIEAYEMRPGTIQLTYLFKNKGTESHSEIWSAEIETA